MSTINRLGSRFAFWFSLVFCGGFIVLFPTSTTWLPNCGKLMEALIHPILSTIGSFVFGFDEITVSVFSDSRAMYALMVFLLMMSAITAGVLSWLNPSIDYARWHYTLTTILRYYLAWQLLYYGFNKVFKWQFFLPEPNTVYTYLGQVSRDLLYWSTIGSSYSFTVIAGVLEVLAAGLLLFHRTFRIGAFLAFIILLNIVIVNFCFNISVKLFSSTLLLMTIVLLRPYLKNLWSTFLNRNTNSVKTFRPAFRPSVVYWLTKVSIIVLLIFDSLNVYIHSGNWNDDLQPRMNIHGAYKVMTSGNTGWKQIFIHRKGYLICKKSETEFIDFRIAGIDTNTHQLEVERYGKTNHLSYSISEDQLILRYGDGTTVTAKRLPYRALPLFRKEFNWWVD